MSQEKVDKRKQSKGDLLHKTKKQMRINTLIIAVILVAAGAFASVVSYNQGYKVGERDGELNMLNYQSLFGTGTSETEGETSTENESGTTTEESTGETAENTTEGETTETTEAE